ncbi:MAG: helicase-associated domain-containing protein, partial [Planctomycetes bacterium]|nr:helicase-associated domain-containing protein [Planctomycetota bacterium]
GGSEDRAKQHARQAYKLFLQPVAIEKRIGRLAPELRELVDVATRRFGGFLPRSVWLETHGDASLFDSEEAGKALTDALVGRFVRLDLARYGIQGGDVSLVVFQDVTLVRLREHAIRHVMTPATERVAGVDLATNLMRYLRYVDENGVRFTVRGEIFQATKKRMLAQLVADDASADDVDAVFDFVDRFARKHGLIDATGERTLRLSEAGRAFEEQGLEDKLRDLLAFAIEDVHGGGGDPFHQRRLRRIVVRLLRRLEPEHWYDAMHVPFLARNAYVVQMNELGVREHVERERSAGRHVVREDLKKLAWHLFDWVRKRLHPLGIVDLGFDNGHPTALRLSRIGATLLQGSPAQAAEGARSTLVVNPDFEILLFPDSDVWPLVHVLDRFAKRTSSDRLYRFVLSEETLRSALADGMGLGQILEVLTLRCRTPLPQNVRFSLEDWAARAGALRLTKGGRIVAPKTELLTRVLAHKRVREVCVGSEQDLRLGDRLGPAEFRSLLRDLGFFLELSGYDEDEIDGQGKGDGKGNVDGAGERNGNA